MKLYSIRNLFTLSTIITLIILILFLKETNLLDIETLTIFIQRFDILAPVIFILIYLIATLLGISATFFSILAGAIFGLWLGWILIIIAANFSANIAFLISRYFKKNLSKSSKINKLLKYNIVLKIVQKIEENAKQNGFMTIILLRMSFLPYIPLSYAAGLVKNLKMLDFTLATLLTSTIASFFFIFLGFSLTQNLSYAIIAIILVLLLTQVPRMIRKVNS